MHSTFTKDPLYEDDIVVFLKNERTGSSTVRKCKFIGQITGFTDTKVKIHQLSKADQFVTPDECVDYGEVSVYPDDVVHVIISKHELEAMYFPVKIGATLYYNKKELIEFVEEHQSNSGLSEVLKKYKLLQCRCTEEQLKELCEYAKQSLIDDGIDLEELKNYID